MSKNIVLCLDGTGNQLKAKGNTNVVRLFELLDLSDPSKQIAYYDPGVGTFSAQGTWTPAGRRTTKLLGLAVGYGLRTNLGEAYTYLMQHYCPGDRIFIAGFSRGAYTARALTGMLNAVGLLRPGSENLVQYAVSCYCRSKRWSDDDWRQLHLFAGTFSRKVDGYTRIPVEYLGLWDSVKAAGILRWNLRWLFTRKIPNARSVRHAVSIDEKRRPYREYLIEDRGSSPAAHGGADRHTAAEHHVEEVWFAGVHSDIGGTFPDDSRLAQITFKWVVDGALEAGLVLKADAYEKSCTVTPENAQGGVHRMGWVWVLLTYRRRRVPADAKVHASVRARISDDPGYRGRIPGTVTWDDPAWLLPSKYLPAP